MRKRSYEDSVRTEVASQEESLADASPAELMPENGFSATSGAVRLEGHSREENWAAEILNRLEQRGKHGLVSLVDGGRWAFGEEEARLRPASPGIAKILSDADLRTLAEIVSEVVGRKVRLTLDDKLPVTGGATASRSPAKSPQRTGVSDASSAAVEEKARQDPEVREFEQLFGKPISGVRRWKG
jgi:hypothetical protein